MVETVNYPIVKTKFSLTDKQEKMIDGFFKRTISDNEFEEIGIYELIDTHNIFLKLKVSPNDSNDLCIYVYKLSEDKKRYSSVTFFDYIFIKENLECISFICNELCFIFYQYLPNQKYHRYYTKCMGLDVNPNHILALIWDIETYNLGGIPLYLLKEIDALSLKTATDLLNKLNYYGYEELFSEKISIYAVLSYDTDYNHIYEGCDRRKAFISFFMYCLRCIVDNKKNSYNPEDISIIACDMLTKK